MDIITARDAIEFKIKEIDDIRKTIRDRGEDKAIKAAEYDMVLASTLIGLKNGVGYDLGGQHIVNPPASTSEKIAKGICWKEKMEMDKAEMLYKSAISNLDSTQSQLNALQSIFRHME